MSRLGWHWPALAVVVLAAGLAISQVEWVEITTDRGFGPEAMRDPYLAADEFLARLDVKVARGDRLQSAIERLQPRDALVMTGSRAGLDEPLIDRLLAWISAGGHLVAVARNPFDANLGHSGDPLLDRLGVRLEVDDQTTGASEELVELIGSLTPEALCGLVAEPSEVHAGNQTLNVSFARGRALSYDGELVGLARNDSGVQLLQIARGAGLVTVLTTTRMWRNARIGCHDGAHLLGVLLGDSATAWWLAAVEMPSLLELLWQRFPLALLGAALTAVLWAWMRGARFGPVRGVSPGLRRSLLEHARASARFYWQRGRGDELLAFLRSEVAVAGGPRLESSEGRAAAARRAGAAPEQLERALRERVDGDREAFLSHVQILQRLRRML